MIQDDNIKDLFRKYIDKELLQEELDQLRNWLNQSAANKELFRNFLSLYKTELQLAALRHIDTDKAWLRIQKASGMHAPKRRIATWAVAASAAIIIGISSLLLWNTQFDAISGKESLTEVYTNEGLKEATLTLSDGRIILLQKNINIAIQESNGNVIGHNSSSHLVYDSQVGKNRPNLYNKISVPPGSEYSITLSDGTRVWLNSESSLEYPIYFATIRDVKLHGEAYFEVAHNANAPFVVEAAQNTLIRVLGTKFNVTAYDPDQIKVTLVEGKVAIESAQGVQQLLPGSQALVLPNGENSITKVNTDIYTSWVTGRFEFNNTPMEDIMTQLSLWYKVKIDFSSPELRNITFTGAILKNKSLGYALELIQKVSNLDFEKDGDVIIVKELKK